MYHKVFWHDHIFGMKRHIRSACRYQISYSEIIDSGSYGDNFSRYRIPAAAKFVHCRFHSPKGFFQPLMHGKFNYILYLFRVLDSPLDQALIRFGNRSHLRTGGNATVRNLDLDRTTS